MYASLEDVRCKVHTSPKIFDCHRCALDLALAHEYKDKWTEFPTPIPVKDYVLKVGTQILISYLSGTVANPEIWTSTYLIGDINKVGGYCDDCSIEKQRDCVVLAERRLVEVEAVPTTTRSGRVANG